MRGSCWSGLGIPRTANLRKCGLQCLVPTSCVCALRPSLPMYPPWQPQEVSSNGQCPDVYSSMYRTQSLTLLNPNSGTITESLTSISSDLSLCAEDLDLHSPASARLPCEKSRGVGWAWRLRAAGFKRVSASKISQISKISRCQFVQRCPCLLLLWLSSEEGSCQGRDVMRRNH